MFDLIVCLNCPGAKERWGSSFKEFQKLGLKGVVRFEALSDIGPHQSFNKSINAILKGFSNDSAQTLLMLEDDVVFQNTEALPAALQELPANWDIVYLGANLVQPGFEAPIPYSMHLRRITNAYTTHAIGFNKKCISFILQNFPDFSSVMFDNWLSCNLHRFNAFAITPMVAIQRSGFSQIWGREVDYSVIFNMSDKLLKTT